MPTGGRISGSFGTVEQSTGKVAGEHAAAQALAKQRSGILLRVGDALVTKPEGGGFNVNTPVPGENMSFSGADFPNASQTLSALKAAGHVR